MAVPRNRHSNARKNTKRSHHALKGRQATRCERCSNPRLPHTMCSNCGVYGDRVVLGEEAEKKE